MDGEDEHIQVDGPLGYPNVDGLRMSADLYPTKFWKSGCGHALDEELLDELLLELLDELLLELLDEELLE